MQNISAGGAGRVHGLERRVGNVQSLGRQVYGSS